MGIGREILLKGSRSQWLASQLMRRRFTRKAVQRFMPGERLEDALIAVEDLSGENMSTILTLLGENVTRSEEAESVKQHYLDVLQKVSERDLSADISIKPTQIGIDLDLETTYARIHSLVKRAAALGKTVAIDMEDSSYVDRTLGLYKRLRQEHSNVAICLQAYLYRTTEDLAALLPLSPMIRLVKGAYNESPEIAYPHRKEVDAAFLKLSETLLQATAKDDGTQAFFGTHDPKMVEGICQRAERLGLAKNAYEFQMLYGIQRQLQSRLASDGYTMRVLISYGESWFPWFMRRLAERPANVLFVVRNLFAA